MKQMNAILYSFISLKTLKALRALKALRETQRELQADTNIIQILVEPHSPGETITLKDFIEVYCCCSYITVLLS